MWNVLFINNVDGGSVSVMNISTSSQIGFGIDCPGFSPPRQDVPAPVSYFPYFDNGYLAVAASLNGGNILKAFVRILQQWVGTLGKHTTVTQRSHSLFQNHKLFSLRYLVSTLDAM